jgi:hypothetical protein
MIERKDDIKQKYRKNTVFLQHPHPNPKIVTFDKKLIFLNLKSQNNRTFPSNIHQKN